MALEERTKPYALPCIAAKSQALNVGQAPVLQQAFDKERFSEILSVFLAADSISFGPYVGHVPKRDATRYADTTKPARPCATELTA